MGFNLLNAPAQAPRASATDSWIPVTPDARPARAAGGGAFLRWDEVGREAIGTYLGVSTGKFGPVGTVETAHGKALFSLPTDLARQLRRVPVEAEVRVRYVSTEPTSSGGEFKRFSVDVRPGTVLLPDDADTAIAPAVDITPAPGPSARPRERGTTPRW